MPRTLSEEATKFCTNLMKRAGMWLEPGTSSKCVALAMRFAKREIGEDEFIKELVELTGISDLRIIGREVGKYQRRLRRVKVWS